MIKITLEYGSVDQAIVALDKLVGAPARATSVAPQNAAEAGAPTTTRKGRSDKGKPRVGKVEGVTAEFISAKTEAATPAPIVSSVESQGAIPAGTPAVAATTPVTDEDIVNAGKAVFDKCGIGVLQQLLAEFGVSRGRDVPADKRAAYVAAAKAKVAA